MKTKNLLKKLILPVVCLAISSNVYADAPVTSFPWVEGFESTTFPPTGWNTYNVVAGGKEWVKRSGTPYAHTGTGAAYHSYFSSGPIESWLVSPAITVPAGYTLEFWSKMNHIESYGYSGVLISTTSSNPSTGNFTEVKKLTGDEVSGTYKKIEVLLDAYGGQTVYIGFKYAGNNVHDWYIDDVKVHDNIAVADAAVTAIVAPVSGNNLTSTETVKATVMNNGTDAISNFEMKLEVNGGTPVIETYNGTIAAGADAEYTFTATADLSAAGDHTVKVTVSLTGDNDDSNDSSTKTVTNTISSGGEITDFPWTEGFEDATFPPTGWNAYNVVVGESQWDRSITSSFVHTGSGSAYHSYSSTDNAESWLVTPPLTISTAEYMLEFWSIMAYLDDYEYSGVWISTASGNPSAGNFTEVKKLTGDEVSGGTYQKIEIPLSDYVGKTIYIAFKYAGDNAHDWYIDDVKVYNTRFMDAAVTAIGAPVSGNNMTSTETVKATIQNNSTLDNISGFTLTLEVDGTLIDTETYSGTIAVGSEADYTFTAKADLSAAGDHVVEVTVNLTGDSNAANDSFTKTVTNTACPPITVFPWAESFDDEVFPPACWASIDNDGDGYNWIRETVDIHGQPSHSGAAYAASYSFINNDNLSLTPDNYLITPPLQIPSGNYEATLTYWIANVDNRYMDNYEVRVSVSGTAPTDFIAQLISEAPAEGWVEKEFKLDNYLGETIYIAFIHKDDDKFGLKLDDVEVDVTSTVGINEQREETMKVYPNPVRDVLYIESPDAILTVSVQDMNGKQLISLSGTGNPINVSHLPQGVYIVKVTTQTETITKKITKQ